MQYFEFCDQSRLHVNLKKWAKFPEGVLGSYYLNLVYDNIRVNIENPLMNRNAKLKPFTISFYLSFLGMGFINCAAAKADESQ